MIELVNANSIAIPLAAGSVQLCVTARAKTAAASALDGLPLFRVEEE